MQQTAVINVVGLNQSLIGEWSPNLRAMAQQHGVRRIRPCLPAVTCSVQSSMLTGVTPTRHGIVGNGWYNRDLADVHFWQQSNHLVQHDLVWDECKAREPSFTCCNMFWWYNMYSTCDISVTPRPMYCADGRKIPDVYSNPPQLRDQLQAECGRFPLFNFWGPMSSIDSSRWIARASMRVHEIHDPTLMLVYLPHLDYGLQKLGPDHEAVRDEVAAIDGIVGELTDFFLSRHTRVVLLSEYGIERADAPVHINRHLRESALLKVRSERGLELLDAGASQAFAVADHQIAHVYVRDADRIGQVAKMCASLDGVEHMLDRDGQRQHNINHKRAGELVLIASPHHWFTYYYWLDDAHAPDFARTVDIHRKPGYDPAELFIDPTLTLPKARIALKLLRKKLGFRTLMDVIPLDATLVRGTHGRVDLPPELQPVCIAPLELGAHLTDIDLEAAIDCTSVRQLIVNAVFPDA